MSRSTARGDSFFIDVDASVLVSVELGGGFTLPVRFEPGAWMLCAAGVGPSWGSREWSVSS